MTPVTSLPWERSGTSFRDRPVVGIHAVDLVWGLGTLHCLTQQQPARLRVNFPGLPFGIVAS